MTAPFFSSIASTRVAGGGRETATAVAPASSPAFPRFAWAGHVPIHQVSTSRAGARAMRIFMPAVVRPSDPGAQRIVLDIRARVSTLALRTKDPHLKAKENSAHAEAEPNADQRAGAGRRGARRAGDVSTGQASAGPWWLRRRHARHAGSDE